MRLTIIRFLFVCAFILPLHSFAHSQDDREFELYLAHISAAEALLQLNETGEAKIHLQQAPAKYRDWEWNYLTSLSDESENTLTGHHGAVRSVAINSAGDLIASGSSDSLIRLWSFPGGTLLRSLSGHKGQVSTLDFSPDGKLLASGSTDKTVKIWDAQTGNEITTISEELSQGIYCVKFHPDGKRLAVASWNFTRNPFAVHGFALLFDIETGKPLQRYKGTGHPMTSVDFSSDGKTLVVGDWGFLIQKFDVDSAKQFYEINIDDTTEYRAIQSVSLSPDGKRVISGSKENRVRIIDNEKGEIIYVSEPWTGHRNDVNTVSFNHDGTMFVSGASDQTVKLWNTVNGSVVRTLLGHTAPINSAVFSPDGNYIISGSSDSTVKIWNTRQSNVLRFKACNNGPWSAPLSPDGKLMAAACSDNGISLWNVTTGTLVGVLPDQAANYAEFSSDSKQLVAGDHNGIVILWNVTTLKEIKRFQGHTNGIYGVAIASRKQWLASASTDKTVRVWDIDEGNEIKQFKFEKAASRFVKFSPDERYLAAGSNDGTITIWNTSDWGVVSEMKTHEGVLNLEFSRDGAMLLAGGEKGTVTLWNMKSYRLLHELKGHTNFTYGIGFHPAGNRIVTASNDLTVKIWDVSTGKLMLTMRDGEREYFCAAFLDNGNKLMLSHGNGVVKILSSE